MSIPEFITPQFVASMITIFVILHLALGAGAYLILLERKVAAWVQDRVGPNRTGPLGLLQPIADGLKLLVKEEFIPRGVDKALFILAPALTVMPALIAFAVIPWGGVLDTSTIPFAETLGIAGHEVKIMGADVHIGIVYLLAATSLGVYGITLGGWASNNKYSFLGGMRAGAQMISYEIPMGVALLTVVLMTGAVRGDEIIGQQLEGQWFLVHQPIAALLFYICLLAEANRAPFDLAEAEQELVGGWHTEYSSMKWALFFLGEYTNLVFGSAFFVLLFMGGWSLNPFFGWDLPAGGGILMILLQVAVVLGKVFILIFLTMMIRWTLPRFRFDQLMRLAWEAMIPTALIVLLATSFAVFMGWTSSMWLISLVMIIGLYVLYPFLPKQADPNHRVPLIGSRFSPLRESDVGASGSGPPSKGP
ncbi:MAG: NADH-quinone oxidoreductase subunit NuoH [Phycisphaerales bacterium]|nr:MAG: NADH-quinone oxidoreductase subunit NuoH [Phycisphaerales bacterium]